MYSLDEHTTTTAGRVIDRLAWLGIENTNKQTYHRTWCIELTSLGLRVIGKLLQQHFVGIAHQVGRIGIVAKIASGKVLDEVANLAVSKDILVGPFLAREHTQHSIEGIRVGQFYLAHGTDYGCAKVFRALAYILPVTAVRYVETMLLRQHRIIHIATALLQCSLHLFVIYIRDALVVENWRDIILEIILAHRTTEYVAGLEQEVVQVLRILHLYLLLCLGSVKETWSIILFLLSHTKIVKCFELVHSFLPAEYSLSCQVFQARVERCSCTIC